MAKRVIDLSKEIPAEILFEILVVLPPAKLQAVCGLNSSFLNMCRDPFFRKKYKAYWAAMIPTIYGSRPYADLSSLTPPPSSEPGAKWEPRDTVGLTSYTIGSRARGNQYTNFYQCIYEKGATRLYLSVRWEDDFVINVEYTLEDLAITGESRALFEDIKRETYTDYEGHRLPLTYAKVLLDVGDGTIRTSGNNRLLKQMNIPATIEKFKKIFLKDVSEVLKDFVKKTPDRPSGDQRIDPYNDIFWDTPVPDNVHPFERYDVLFESKSEN